MSDQHDDLGVEQIAHRQIEIVEMSMERATRYLSRFASLGRPLATAQPQLKTYLICDLGMSTRNRSEDRSLFPWQYESALRILHPETASLWED